MSVQQSIRARVDYHYNPGIIVGVVNAEGRTFFSYGRVDLDSDMPPNDNTLYEIGSVTKVFTTTLLSEMVSRGEVSLDDTVQSLLPDGVRIPSKGNRHVNLQHLATHSSGFQANPPFDTADPVNPFAHFSESELYAFLSTNQLTTVPGSTYEYSNLGMGLLGHALAERLGMAYESALRQRVLTPLGLSDTRLTLSPDQTGRRAPGYNGVVPRPPFDMASLAGAGELVSSASDLLTFLEYQLGLRQTDLAPVITVTQAPHFATTNPSLSIGLGWFILAGGAIQFTFHDGATMGQTAFVGFNRNTQMGVVVLTNARVNEYSNIQDIGVHLLEPQLDLTRIVAPASVPLSTLRGYFGRYQADDGTSCEVGLLHEHLTIAFAGPHRQVFTLYPQSLNAFRLLELGVNGRAVFPPGNVGLSWSQTGYGVFLRKQDVPARLALQVKPDEAILTLTGNTDTDYVIESSTDLTNWLAFATNTIWDGPITDPQPPSNAQRFYRAWSPAP